MSDKTFNPGLWTPRSVAETQDIYANWADQYDADVSAAGYVTPTRVARALAELCPDRTTSVLDFGCGTGLSGAALRAEGFLSIDGTDISPEMLAHAAQKDIYATVWLSKPGDMPEYGRYPVIVATGVVSLGAAPPETLTGLLDSLGPKGLLAFSYNDATLDNADYLTELTAAQASSDLIFEDYGPHLPAKDMGAKVYVLQKH